MIEEADSVFLLNGDSGYDTENGYIVTYYIYILHNITMRKVFLDARKASDIYDDLFASQGKSF